MKKKGIYENACPQALVHFVFGVLIVYEVNMSQFLME